MSVPPVCLRGLGHRLAGKTWQSYRPLRIGRLADVEVFLDDPSVSRVHAEVAPGDGGWVARDLGSTNGTFLNGSRVGRADRLLRSGDHLQVGVLAVQVSIVSPAALDSARTDEEPAVSAVVRQSSDEAVQLLAHRGGLTATDPRYLALLRAGRDLCEGSLDGLMDSVMRDALKALGAVRAAVLLADEGTDSLMVRGALPEWGNADSHAWLDMNLAERAFRKGESLLAGAPWAKERSNETTSRAGDVYALLRTRRKMLGVLCLHRGPGRQPFDLPDLALADALACSVSGAFEAQADMQSRERALLVQTLTTLAQAVELRDDSTNSHTQRVTDYALLLAEEMGLPEFERSRLRMGTPLHDIGKIGIVDAVLLKAGPLTDPESEYMRSHTWKGAALLEGYPQLTDLTPIVRSHHEKWDGSGYPDGLVGEKIPLLARLVAVADAFDAMTSDRPYRMGMDSEEAFKELELRSGSQFDPGCVDAFLRLAPRIKNALRERRQLEETGGMPLLKEHAKLGGRKGHNDSTSLIELPAQA